MPLDHPARGPAHRHWQVSSRHHQTRTLDYGYLLGLLEDMQAHWEEAASLPQEQEESLADSFSAFSEFGLRLLRQLRHYFPATNSTAVYRLELLLKCLDKLQLFQPSFEICPFETELNMDIAAALKRGNHDWYDRLLSAKSPREQPGPQRLAGLIKLVDTVYEDLQSCYGIYASLFHSILKVDFFTLTFRQLERLMAEEAWVLTEELGPKMTPEVASGLLELYLTLADTQRFWGCIPGRWSPWTPPPSTAARRPLPASASARCRSSGRAWRGPMPLRPGGWACSSARTCARPVSCTWSCFGRRWTASPGPPRSRSAWRSTTWSRCARLRGRR